MVGVNEGTSIGKNLEGKTCGVLIKNRFFFSLSDRDSVSKYHSSRYRGKEKARAPIQDTTLGTSVSNPNHASTLHTIHQQ